MSQLVEINLSSTNLTGLTNQFSVFVKDCSDITFTTVETGLTYSNFPYLVDLESAIGVVSCYDYKVVESLTNLSCSGQTIIPSPTPSITPTTTPSECDGIDCEVAVTPVPSITPTQTPISPLSCDVNVTPIPTTTPTQTIITPLDCEINVTPYPSVTPTQTIITPLDCDVNVQ